MFRAPSAELSATGWVCFTVIWLFTVAAFCVTFLAATRQVIRFLERRRRPLHRRRGFATGGLVTPGVTASIGRSACVVEGAPGVVVGQ